MDADSYGRKNQKTVREVFVLTVEPLLSIKLFPVVLTIISSFAAMGSNGAILKSLVELILAQ